MMNQSPLLLERPAFWTEARDPEVWFRALHIIVAQAPKAGSTQLIIRTLLRDTCSRRTVLGLFGSENRAQKTILHGVGLLEQNDAGLWQPTQQAQRLVHLWTADRTTVLVELASYLMHVSVWMRLLVLRLQRRDWSLLNWSHVRSQHRIKKGDDAIRLIRHSEPATWFVGLEQQVAGHWLNQCGRKSIAMLPAVLSRPAGKDNLSLVPLIAPLHLLDLIGWLDADGRLQLPASLQADLMGGATPAQQLREITDHQADVRGFVAVEPVLRELLAQRGGEPDAARFIRWMDALITRATASGALEILAAEPGQARHGRGLGGESSRRLVRWAIHPEFDGIVADLDPLLDGSASISQSCQTVEEHGS